MSFASLIRHSWRCKVFRVCKSHGVVVHAAEPRSLAVPVDGIAEPECGKAGFVACHHLALGFHHTDKYMEDPVKWL